MPQVHVPLPDLSRFNHLLGEPGGRDDPGDEGLPLPPRLLARARSPCFSPDRVDLTCTGLDWRVRTVL